MGGLNLLLMADKELGTPLASSVPLSSIRTMAFCHHAPAGHSSASVTDQSTVSASAHLQLAEDKDAFLKAHPNYKWHCADKSQGTSAKMAASKPTNSMVIKSVTRIHTDGSIIPGKLADPEKIGGLNFLVMADKEMGTPLASSVPLSSIRTMAVSHRAPAEHSSASVTDQSTVSASAFLQLAEKMDGGETKEVRRPMNAFLIFCKRHRGFVREKNPDMDNHCVTRVLGDLWANLGEEKKIYTNLAKQDKDAFLKAHPNYKWHCADKSQGTSAKMAASKPTNSMVIKSVTRIHTDGSIIPGKLADPEKIGGLNFLVMADKEMGTPLASSVPLSSIRTMAVSHRAPAEHSSASVTDQSTVSASAFLQLAEKMDGGETKEVRRPMNAFLIFCKRHRGFVREKNPDMDNHCVTRVLGDLWANLGEEKKIYTNLAKQDKDAFLKAHPNYKWHCADKSQGTSAKMAASKPTNSMVIKSVTRIHTDGSIIPGKLADPEKIGGLNFLVMADKEMGTPLASSVPLSSIRTMAVSHRAPAEHSSASVTDQSTVSASAFLQLAEKMDGGETKEVRRPMNAFLIFCKRHRGFVREKNPDMDNHCVTRVLGDLWANLGEEKKIYTNLAKQDKDAFLKAHPNYKWHCADKSQGTSAKMAASKPTNSMVIKSVTRIHTDGSIIPGKLADPEKIGGLNFLVMADKEMGTPLASSVPLSSIRTMAVSHRAPAEHSSASVTDQSTVSASAFLQLAEKMDGGETKEVRRPMNAFLIFCKRHRGFVREKNPDMDNHCVTRVLGDLWANLGEEKKIYTNLAKQDKDAFLKAHPNYKWHCADKSQGTSAKMAASKPTNSMVIKSVTRIHTDGSIIPGKLADPEKIGGLNFLVMADKEMGTPLASSVPLSSIRTMAVSHRAPAEHSSASVTDQSTVSASAFLQLAEKMDGGETKEVRRPMNAFLIFCKRHRGFVREKNPDMDNHCVTRVLGDLWANLGEEKKIYTNLAKQDKDAFLKAHPNYKWHCADKSQGTSAKMAASKPTNSMVIKSVTRIHTDGSIIPGKLADPEKIGGLNFLVMADKEMGTPLASSVPLSSIRTMAVSHRAPAEHSSASVTDQSTVSASAFLQLAEKMDGGETKEVRRPMNAFLIFCKRHRGFVREKNPDMDNHCVTRVLGDLWANLGEEKKIYTNLAKQDKDAFLKAHPNYKWHCADKSQGTSAKMAASKPTNSMVIKSVTRIHTDGSIIPGKLADPEKIGGLNFLVMADKEMGTPLASSVPLSSIRTMAVSHRAPAEHSSASVTDQSTVSASAFLQLAEKMDGGETKEVRRPMNAFLIFCKRHRGFVREKNPDMDNHCVTRVLGDLWANLGEEKKIYTNLAKQDKDAFLKAHPNYKWHCADKSQGTSAKMAASKPTNSMVIKSVTRIHTDGSIIPGKLAARAMPCWLKRMVLLIFCMLISGVKADNDCPPSLWGEHCTQTCGYCKGGDNFCHPLHGYCRDGCSSGYTGITCHEKCNIGSWGPNCKNTCLNCLRSACDPTSGKCYLGCKDGYMMPYCSINCPVGKWGAECEHTCGMCHGGNQYCNPYFGFCENGCMENYTGKTCNKLITHLENKLNGDEHASHMHLDPKCAFCLIALGSIITLCIGYVIYRFVKKDEERADCFEPPGPIAAPPQIRQPQVAAKSAEIERYEESLIYHLNKSR